MSSVLRRETVAEQGATPPRVLLGLFSDRGGAQGACDAVSSRGYLRTDVYLLMTDEARGRWFPGGLPAATRGRGGSDVRLSLVVPGAGGGAVARLLTFGRVRPGGGGLVRLLDSWGVPQDRALTYEAGLLQGGILVAVTPRTEDEARSLLREWKAASGEHLFYFQPPPRASP